VTYHVDHLHHSGTTRVSTVTERPGGKAVNVARMLYRFGEPTRLVASAGGGTADEGSVPQGDDDDPARAARALSRSSGATVVVSLGDDGVVAASPAGVWEARPASALVGNPRGTGAAVLSPGAGDVDPAHHEAQLPGVVVHALDSAR
jgi:fructose-1-phosphate kinase PfkB-like protein